MIPLDGRPIPGLDVFERREAERQSRAVASRTQTKPFFNLQTGNIFLARGPVPQMGFTMPFKTLEGTIMKREQHELDDFISYCNLSLVSNSTKDRWSAQHEKRAESDREKKRQEFFEERRGDALSYAEHRSKVRRGVQTKVVTL